MNKVVVSSYSGDRRLRGEIRRAALELLTIVRVDRVILEITLLGNQKMVGLKRKFYLGHLSANAKKTIAPASVLAFPEPRGFLYLLPGRRFLGEIYLNRDLTKGKFKEAAPLLIHGFLHLIGYRHSQKSDILKMERMERRLEKRIMKRHLSP